METATYYLTFRSELGYIEICGTQDAITAVNFREELTSTSTDIPEHLQLCKSQVEEYFSGTRTTFQLPLDPGGTDFQRKVWNELLALSFGNTTTYSSIAKKMLNPGSVRAVGSANARNPIAIIIPCHRVIGESGKLTGYAGGLWRKQWLLQHEQKFAGRGATLFG